jgi:CHASE2 domain-containing sensor protein
LDKTYDLTEDKIKLFNIISLKRANNNEKEVLINYAKSSQFKRVSFLDIYYNKFNKNDFKDKIVVI